MFTNPLLTILLAQGILGSAYVILDEENGYYKAWHSNPLEPKSNPWSSFINPQQYFPFLQNMNPFSWWQPQQPISQENPAHNIVLYDRQKVLFHILKCVVEEESKDICKKMLGNALPLFQDTVQVTEIWITSHAPSKPTGLEMKPLEVEPTMLLSKPAEVELPQSKPNEIGVATMEVKPVMIEPAIIPKPLQVDDPGVLVKPIEMDSNPMIVEPALPNPLEIEEVMNATEIEPIKIKPIESEPAVPLSKPMEELPESEPVKPIVIGLTAMESNPIVIEPAPTKPLEIEEAMKSSEIKPTKPFEVEPVVESVDGNSKTAEIVV